MNDFVQRLEKLNINYDESLQNKFDFFYKSLIDENKIINLTRIVDKDEVYYLHFYDSLFSSSIMDLEKENIEVLDIGSGAGFPGLPLAIAFNNIKLTSLDAVNKKINFQNKIIKGLNLKNVKAIHTRIEDYKEYEKFDYVVSRALSSLSKQLLLSLPFLKIGGKLIAYKGSLKASEEIDDSIEQINKLNGKIVDRVKYNVLDRSYELIVIEKINKTPILSKKIKGNEIMNINEGDVLELKKSHPCGSRNFIVLKSGVDCKIKCQGCGHELLIDRVNLKKSVKSRIINNKK